MKRSIALAAALCAGTLGAGTAQAQRSHIGTHAGYHFDAQGAALGGQLLMPVAPRLELYPSATVYFVDRGSLWGFNVDMKYRSPTPVYLGAGLNVARRSVNGVSDTETGANLIGGLESRWGMVHPFLEGRVILNSASAFQFLGGINVTLR